MLTAPVWGLIGANAYGYVPADALERFGAGLQAWVFVLGLPVSLVARLDDLSLRYPSLEMSELLGIGCAAIFVNVLLLGFCGAVVRLVRRSPNREPEHAVPDDALMK